MLREEMKLFAAFPGSVIREDGTFAVLGDPDCGLDLTVCETQEDISVHLLENLSKSACRVRTYDVPDGQEPRRVRLLRGMNQYLGTSLSEEDMTNVYRKIGNSIHPDLSRSFVEANCDMSVLIPEGSQTDYEDNSDSDDHRGNHIYHISDYPPLYRRTFFAATYGRI